MTRINIVPVEKLTDQHLIAEYREITMIPASLSRTLASKNGLNHGKIPKKYTLNKGHVYFFYDKGLYLSKRYDLLKNEMKRRGFKPDKNRKFPKDIFKENGLYNDWKPNAHDYLIIEKRIKAKINLKPQWYKMTSVKQIRS